MDEIKGRIHSIESLGTVDGPGIRMVVFFQGCPMRCKYCHNPDSWNPSRGTEMTVSEIMERFEKNAAFYTNGGITATGGEPLMQLEFLTALFEEASKKGIHTCLDTSGILYHPDKKNQYERLLDSTSLVLLDIKHSSKEGHLELTKMKQEPVLMFQKVLEEKNIPIVLRHVVVPGITDSEEENRALGKMVALWRNLKGLDVLPYHSMGEKKYKELGIPYELSGLRDATKEEAKNCKEMILSAIKEERMNLLS